MKRHKFVLNNSESLITVSVCAVVISLITDDIKRIPNSVGGQGLMMIIEPLFNICASSSVDYRLTKAKKRER